jgi:hypothetical protein
MRAHVFLGVHSCCTPRAEEIALSPFMVFTSFLLLFGHHVIYLLRDLWASAMVIAAFVSYRRKNLWSLTADQGKSLKWENY